MRRSLIVMVIATAGLIGCRPAPGGTAPPPSGEGTSTPTDPAASASESPSGASDPEAPVECAASGVAWNGRHDGCAYEVAGCCYPTPSSACAAAGCSERCQILEVFPAQVQCPAKAAAPAS